MNRGKLLPTFCRYSSLPPPNEKPRPARRQSAVRRNRPAGLWTSRSGRVTLQAGGRGEDRGLKGRSPAPAGRAVRTPALARLPCRTLDPACLASWGIVAEDEPRTQAREGFGIPGVYLVGGGDVPSARTGCVGLPDGLPGLSRPRAQPAVVVNPAKLCSGRLTFKWAASDYG